MIIGIIGAGQLGMMLGESARELGCGCIFLDPNKNSPAKINEIKIIGNDKSGNSATALVVTKNINTYITQMNML